MQRGRTIAAWVFQVLLGLMFVLAGVGKFQNWDAFVSRFEAWGYAPWFLILIGVLEALGGALVFVPRLAAYGAALIGSIMLGAAYTHASTGIGSPVQVVLPLVFCAAVLYFRWADRWGGARPDAE
jgi:uncharacterized membrane protein YphA (DoxX/SURF4 family)